MPSYGVSQKSEVSCIKLSIDPIADVFQGLYFAGLFLFLNAKHDKAREYIDRMLKMAPTSVEVRCPACKHCCVQWIGKTELLWKYMQML